MKSFAMMVLGCKVNDYEATSLKEKMLTKYIEKSFKEIADIYIIFTCCVTNIAEAKTRKMIRRARTLNPNAYIVAVGCLAQTKTEDEIFNNVDLLIGSTLKDKIFSYIEEGLKENKVKELHNLKFEELNLNSYPGKSRSFLKIQDGCNQFCSYCIIPYSRGNERSANHNYLIEQAKRLSINSSELVLTGIHTGRYNDGKYDLYSLLCSLEKIEGIKTIRLSSIEINEISDEIIELIKKSKTIAHHLHIPVQSCSNTILKLMHRPYTIEEYINRINSIRHKIPDISISTDLIVGFPSESDELFKETIENIKKIEFSFIHVFPYARKKGTNADKLNGHLNNDIKKQRVNEIIELEKKYTKKYICSFIGKEVLVLVEKKDDDYIYGYAKQYFYIKAKGQANIGEIIKVVVDNIDEEVIGHVSR